jgi:glutathione S-transferase
VTDRLYHLALADEWAAALEAGEYRRSTRGVGLDEVGFVHLAFAHQVAEVHARWFADAGPVTVVEVDPERVGADLRVEDGFPHLYGPLPLAAVVGTRPWPPG